MGYSYALLRLKLSVRALSTEDRRSVSLWQSPVILVTEKSEILIPAFTYERNCH